MYLRQPIKKKNKSPFIFAGALIALFLALTLVKGGFSPAVSSISKTVLSVSSPVFSVKNKIFSWAGNIVSGFNKNIALKKENEFLKERTKKLELENTLAKEIFKENKVLNEVLNRDYSGGRTTAALILARPGYGIYDSLIIGSGADRGIKEGEIATAFGTVLLGHVFDVTSGISKVKLVSYPGEEVSVFVGGRFAASAKGTGGANMEISIPKDIEVFIGDNVIFSGDQPLLLGIVEKIIKEPAEPFQKALFRLPVNLNEISSVFILTK